MAKYSSKTLWSRQKETCTVTCCLLFSCRFRSWHHGNVVNFFACVKSQISWTDDAKQVRPGHEKGLKVFRPGGLTNSWTKICGGTIDSCIDSSLISTNISVWFWLYQHLVIKPIDFKMLMEKVQFSEMEIHRIWKQYFFKPWQSFFGLPYRWFQTPQKKFATGSHP